MLQPRRFLVPFFSMLGLVLLACSSRQESQPLPTLVPTISFPEIAPTIVVTDTAVSPTTSVEYTPTFEPAPCPDGLPPEANVTCGYVIVPEDRMGNAQDTVRLAVAHFRSPNPASNPIPIIYLQGGPGGATLEYLVNYYPTFIAPMQNQRDVILFDQRGVGLSEPELDCWGLKSTYLQDMRGAFTENERVNKYREAVLTCRDRLQEQGVNLAAYHTAVNAADVYDILNVLGYSRAHLFAVSYGTRLAQYLMRDYPQLVESAILDSVVPIETNYDQDTSDSTGRAVDSVIQACVTDLVCQAAYPDLAAVYADLQTTLRQEPLLISFTDPVQGGSLEVNVDDVKLKAALQWALYDSYLTPLIPKMLYDLQAGDSQILSYALSAPLRTYGNLSLGVMFSVLCHDQVFASTLPADGQNLSIKRLGLMSVIDEDATLVDLCTQWGAAPAVPGQNTPVSSNIPTLILTGKLDTTTPPDDGYRVAEMLGQSYVIEFPNQGHAPTFSAGAVECAQTITAAFLTDPAASPDSSCLEGLAQASFYVPYDGSQPIPMTVFMAVNPSFTTVIPANWQDAGYNHFNWLRFYGDPTQFGVQGAVTTTERWLFHLMETYAGSGLEEFPEFVEDLSLNGRVWHLYTTTYRGNPVTLAFTEAGDYTYFINFVSMPQEHDALFTNVMIPAMESLIIESSE